MQIPGLQSFTQSSMWILNGLKDDVLYLADKCARIIDKQFNLKTEERLDKLFFDYKPYGEMYEVDVHTALNVPAKYNEGSITDLEKQFNTALKTDQLITALTLFAKSNPNQNPTFLLPLQKNTLDLVEKKASRFSLFTILSTSKEKAAVAEFCKKERTEAYTSEDIAELQNSLKNPSLKEATS